MNKEEALKYIDAPEGTNKKKIYDFFHKSFQEYLDKYYSTTDLTKWNDWHNNYVKYAYDSTKRGFFLEKLNLSDSRYYNFHEQEVLFNQLVLKDVPLDIAKFIGFMGGFGFFAKNEIKLDQWLMTENWKNPRVEKEFDEKSVQFLLKTESGKNYLRVMLTQLPFWRR